MVSQIEQSKKNTKFTNFDLQGHTLFLFI